MLTLKIFSVYRLKSVLISSSRGLLVRELRVKNASAGLFDGLVIEDFSLSKYPGFKSGTFLTAEKLTVKTNSLRLFKRKFEFSSISLVSPSFDVSRKDGFFNLIFPFMFAGRGLFIKELNVKDADIKYELVNKQIVYLSGINLNCRDITLKNPFYFTADMVLHANKSINISCSGSADLSNQSINFDNLVLKSQDSTLYVNGSVYKILDKDRNFSASLKGSRKVFEQVLGFLPGSKNISFFDKDSIDINLSYSNNNLVCTQRRE